MRLKVGINGFGRIGRAFTRIAILRDSFDIVAINTRKTAPEMLAYLLQHDSIYRAFAKNVSFDAAGLIVDGKHIAVTQFPEIEHIPWGKYEVDVVVDATGAFTRKEDLTKHITNSVKKVVLTAPAKDDMTHCVLGVNDQNIDWKKETVISNASCTTNSAAPLFKVLHDNFNVLVGYITTTHAYTQSQPLQDDPGKTFDRSRSAVLNIVPTTTGAAEAVVKSIPQLKGKIDGMAIRVPVATGSFSDVTALVEKKTTAEEVNKMFAQAAQNSMKNILKYETQKLVSSDYIGSPFSCIFDSNYTKVVNNHLVKVFGWYDNEWGYSTRLVDLVDKIASAM